MRPFTYQRATDPAAAVAAAGGAGDPLHAAAQFLAGGTTLLDLMKLDVMRPERLIDIGPLTARYGAVERRGDTLHLGALARMADVADHPLVRGEVPLIADSLALAASGQLRNMATIGGNVLQRTRCHYFRDTSWTECNKRTPGSGCAAQAGVNRMHAVLGTSDDCIASYPGDFAQALIALDATVRILGSRGERTIPFAELHRLPGDTPQLETTLAAGELITGFDVPLQPWLWRSLYLKVRDRESYAFATASAAVALDLVALPARPRVPIVREARIALGGVATVPWRARAAEDLLRGKSLDADQAGRAALAAFADAETLGGNDFKPDLGQRTLVRAILQAVQMGSR